MTKNKKPLILVTNDDGYYSKGIAALIQMVKPYGDIVVVAPDQAHSGMSHAITVKHPLFAKEIPNDMGVKLIKSNGTPADCVKLAINKLLDRKPDFCVSGINHGSNSSVSVHYSGTIGAAREAALYGIPSIGFSLLSYDHDADFLLATPWFEKIFKLALKQGIETGIYWNVNAPYGIDIKGIRTCRQNNGRWIEEFLERKDPRNETYYWLTGRFQNDEPEATDTDEYLLENGYVTLVPCLLDISCTSSINKLNKAVNEL